MAEDERENAMHVIAVDAMVAITPQSSNRESASYRFQRCEISMVIIKSRLI